MPSRAPLISYVVDNMGFSSGEWLMKEMTDGLGAVHVSQGNTPPEDDGRGALEKNKPVCRGLSGKVHVPVERITYRCRYRARSSWRSVPPPRPPVQWVREVCQCAPLDSPPSLPVQPSQDRKTWDSSAASCSVCDRWNPWNLYKPHPQIGHLLPFSLPLSVSRSRSSNHLGVLR